MNKKKYKEAIEEIKVDENLKNKTYQKMIGQRKNKIYLKVLAMCAIFILVVSISYMKLDNTENNTVEKKEETLIAEKEIDLPRFKDMEELKEYLKNNTSSKIYLEDTMKSEDIEQNISTTTTLGESNESTNSENSDYSKTNIQVEGVDEADIIKTDGRYIYYVVNSSNNNKIIIIDSESLEILDEIDDFENDEESLSPSEIFIKNNKLIVLANKWKKGNYGSSYNYNSRNSVCALIFDITDKGNVELERNVEIGGNYLSSRMIDDNLYFITQRGVSYYEDCKDIDIIPYYIDTAITEEEKCISLDSIYYFPETEENSYINVVGVDIENKDEANIETFLGASSEIYSSKQYLYLTKSKYNYYNGLLRESYDHSSTTEIYKLKLDNSKITFKAKAEINGYINNQFSMDEYNNNLRIATTSYDKEGNTSNNLYILDEDLNQIGSIEKMAEEEKIYSVRFIGKTGYIVTFKQVDPLFVIDLSNPEKPEIKGQLKIPGYSSYLHPYDDTHIIGIGKNTEETTYGSTVSTNMKMSMFDISDLSNPTEMFSVLIGGKGTYSEILDNHKALFFNKEKNLIGFPITIYEDGSSYSYKTKMQGAIIYEIDLNEGFIEKGTISIENAENNYYSYDYNKVINRMIYIEDKIYAFSNSVMKVVDINTLEEKRKIEY